MLRKLRQKIMHPEAGTETTLASLEEEKKVDEATEWYTDIRFDINKVNMDKFVRKRAFERGAKHPIVAVAPPEGPNPVYEPFHWTGDFLPIIPKEEILQSSDYDRLLQTRVPAQSESSAVAGGNHERLNYAQPGLAFGQETMTEPQRREFMSKFKLLQTRKVPYDKPVAIIINPNSGTMTNLIPRIEQSLSQEGIPFEFFSTQGPLDTYRFGRDLDLSRFSLLVACGGDGSCHEVVNGMLSRADKIKLPVAFIPNGSSNDLCRSIGIQGFETALNYIIKGECVKVDNARVLIDCDSEEGLPETEERLQSVRYMNHASGLSLPPRVSQGAIPLKPYCGNRAYDFSFIWDSIKGNCKADDFDLFIDDEKVSAEDDHTSTTMLFVSNGKSSGGLICNPFALLNDGLLDVTWISDPAMNGFCGAHQFVKESKKLGGISYYKGYTSTRRGRKIKVIYRGRRTNTEAQNRMRQPAYIDGENFTYANALSYEIIPNNLEVMFNPDLYFNEYQIFEQDNQEEKRRQVEDLASQAFSDFDADRDGRLTKSETERFMTSVLAESFDESEFEAAFQELCKDGSDHLHRNDLESFLLRV